MGSNKDFANAAPGAEGYRFDHPAAAHLHVIDKDKGLVDIGDRKNIAICGFASSSRHLIPTDDPKWIIAGLNQLYRHMPRADVWYDIHVNWNEENVDGTDHEGWIRTCGVPVFMSNPPAALPDAVRYPIEHMLEKHGVDYFTSTVSFMIAWAIDCIDRAVILNGDRHSDYAIGIYGIDLIVGTEYEVQKACAEFWLGVAEGRGIKIVLPPQTALLKQTHRYGYEKEPSSGVFGLAELKSRVKELESFSAKQTPMVHAMNGAKQALVDLLKKPEVSEQKPLVDLLNRGIAEADDKLNKLIAEIQTYDGAAQEAQHHVNVMELRQRGGVVPITQTSVRT